MANAEKIAAMEETLFGILAGKAAVSARYTMAMYFDRIAFDPTTKAQEIAPWRNDEWWSLFRVPLSELEEASLYA